jgi:hypothetical protein
LKRAATFLLAALDGAYDRGAIGDIITKTSNAGFSTSSNRLAHAPLKGLEITRVGGAIFKPVIGLTSRTALDEKSCSLERSRFLKAVSTASCDEAVS